MAQKCRVSEYYGIMILMIPYNSLPLRECSGCSTLAPVLDVPVTCLLQQQRCRAFMTAAGVAPAHTGARLLELSCYQATGMGSRSACRELPPAAAFPCAVAVLPAAAQIHWMHSSVIHITAISCVTDT
jgi:hypothetical protein